MPLSYTHSVSQLDSQLDSQQDTRVQLTFPEWICSEHPKFFFKGIHGTLVGEEILWVRDSTEQLNDGNDDYDDNDGDVDDDYDLNDDGDNHDDNDDSHDNDDDNDDENDDSPDGTVFKSWVSVHML